MSQNPRYRVLTNLTDILRSLNSSYTTALYSGGNWNHMATITNLGMLAEDLTDLGHTAIAARLVKAAKMIFSYPMFINNHIVKPEVLGPFVVELNYAMNEIEALITNETLEMERN